MNSLLIVVEIEYKLLKSNKKYQKRILKVNNAIHKSNHSMITRNKKTPKIISFIDGYNNCHRYLTKKNKYVHLDSKPYKTVNK